MKGYCSRSRLTQIKKLPRHKVSKVTKKQKLYEIAVKSAPSSPPLPTSSGYACPLSPSSISSTTTTSTSTSTPYTPTSGSDDVHSLANRLKYQLSNALTKVPSSVRQFDDSLEHNQGVHPVSPAVASGDTSPGRHHRLRNLDLLKQYLMFVAQEASVDIQHDDDSGSRTIVIGVPREDHKNAHEIHPGARLIETYVHGQSKMMSIIDGQNKTAQAVPSAQLSRHRRRRSGSSSGSSGSNNSRQRRKSEPAMATKQGNVIKCICATPNEEFGAMVQCNACRLWLHQECLKMTGDVFHRDTFQCPQCFVSNSGGGHNAVVGDRCSKMDSRRRVSCSSITWRYAARQQSERMAASMDLEMTSDDEDDEGHDQQSTSCDDDLVTSSEASTPEQSFYIAHHQDASQLDCFVPHASDVFLCESSIHGPASISPTTVTTDALPSSLCSQDLLEFSFDTGPFWKPIH